MLNPLGGWLPIGRSPQRMLGWATRGLVGSCVCSTAVPTVQTLSLKFVSDVEPGGELVTDEPVESEK